MKKILFLLLGMTMLIFFSGCACLHCGAFIAKDNIAVNNGYKALEGGDFASAEAYFNEALACNPNNLHAILYLGVVYHKTKRFEKACEMYTKVIEMNTEVKCVHGPSNGKLLTVVAEENLGNLRTDCPMMAENEKGPCLNCPPPAPAPVVGPCPDSDSDGVCDDADKCPNTPAGVKVDERGCWVISAVLLFDFDKADLKPEAKEVLDKGYELLKDNQLNIEIQGYTCSIGSEAYNQKLSERRAEAVKSYLVEKGIDESRLTTKGFGENNPVASNDTEEGRIKNRRVEFKTVE